MKELNKKTLNLLFENNVIFSIIKDDMKKNIIKEIDDITIDLDKVDDVRVGNEFVKYLIKVKHVEILKYFNDLELYLTIIASLNNRRNITQSDLILLKNINMDELNIENWDQIIDDSVKETMFRELIIYLDNNGDIKDDMTNKFENNKLSNDDIQKAKELINWLDDRINQLTDSYNQVLSGPQLINIFNQDMINKFYGGCIDFFMRKMKFQRLGFSVAAK